MQGMLYKAISVRHRWREASSMVLLIPVTQCLYSTDFVGVKQNFEVVLQFEAATIQPQAWLTGF